MITRLRYVGWVVESIQQSAADLDKLFGMKLLPAEDIKGFTAGRALFPNECWLFLQEAGGNNPAAAAFYKKHGENLDHIALESDNLQEEIERLNKAGFKVSDGDIEDGAEGRSITVPAEEAIGFGVKIIEPRAEGFKFDKKLCGNPDVLGLQHIGVAVKDMQASISRFETLFGIKAEDLREDQHYGTQKDMMINTGNDRLWLHLVQTDDPENRVFQFRQQHGAGLEHLCIEVDDIRDAVKRVKAAGVPLYLHKIYLDREDGFESFVYPEYNHGVTVELIEPYEDSRGYRPRPRK